jgi:hypothetical protein
MENTDRGGLAMLRIGLLVGCLVVAGCSFAPGSGSDPYGPPEAVVKFLLPRAAGATVYIALPDGDPPAEFLGRFANNPTPVLAGSKVPAAGGPAGYSIKIHGMNWDGPDTYRIFVLDHPTGEVLKCGTPYPIVVKKQAGVWTVIAS